jgi:hypothetical protein
MKTNKGYITIEGEQVNFLEAPTFSLTIKNIQRELTNQLTIKHFYKHSTDNKDNEECAGYVEGSSDTVVFYRGN